MKSIYKSEFGRNEVLEYYREILIRSPVAQKGYLIDTVLGKTFLLECGKCCNPPLLLLHGTSSNSASWFGDIKQFSERFQVYSIDIPGEPGLSSGSRPELTSGEYTKWLKEVVDILDLDKINLAGQSFGGWLALKFASHYHSIVNKLVLISPSGIAPQKLSFLFKFIPLMLLGEYGQKKIDKLINHKEILSDEAIEFGRLIKNHFIYRMEDIPVLSDEELDKISSEILYFGGDKDVILDSFKSIARLNKIKPDADARLLIDTGHLVLNKTNEIMEFLEK